MAKNKTVTYNYKTGEKIQDKKVGNKKTVSKVTYGKKAGPKGFQRKAKIVDKKTPGGGRSTAVYASDRTLKSIGPDDAAGKDVRENIKAEKAAADSVTIGKKTYKTKNKKANPNLRKRYNF